MSKANQFAKNDEAVSAVIGVILMVAITVILAAVIAAFVIGMNQGVKKSYVVAVTCSRIDMDTICISNMGGNDVDELVDYVDATHGPFKVYINGVDQTTTAVGASKLNEGVGTSVTLIGITPRSHLIVTGFFADGTEQILLATDV